MINFSNCRIVPGRAYNGANGSKIADMGEFNIQSKEMIQGDLPQKAVMLVQEWLNENADKPQEMWDEQQIYKLPQLQ